MAALDLSHVALALGGDVAGGQVLAPGPNHSPKDRSMSVKLVEGAPDGFVVESHSGDDFTTCRDHVRARLGLPAWAPSRAGPSPLERMNTKAAPGPWVEYIYRDQQGEPYLRVQRTPSKAFLQSHWTGTAWAKGKPSGPKLPYRLPDLLAAVHDTRFICEGEKDADALAALGMAATSASEGAGKWTPDLNHWFKGCTVYIMADNDAKGAEHADQVARQLHGVASDVRVINLPGLPSKGDVSDWLAAGGDPATLVDFCKAQPLFDPTVPLSHPLGERDSGTLAALRVDSLDEIAGAVMPKREHVLSPILHCRSLAMVYAARGVGKTHVGLGVGYATASGGAFLRWRAEKPRRVLMIDGEMPAELLQERIRTMMRGADKPLPAAEWFRVIAMDRQELGVALNLALPEHQGRIEEHLEGAELLILDNISTLVHGGRENDAESWDSMQPWLLHLRRRGVSVLLIAHAGRGENARGTSKREDVLDTVIQLRRPDDYEPEEGARFEVRITKGRGVFGDDAAAFEAKLEVRDGADNWSAAMIQDLAFERVLELTKGGKSVRDIGDELSISKSKVGRLQAKLKAEGRL